MAPAGLRPEEDRVGRQASCLHPASGDDGMANEAVPVVQVQRQREVLMTAAEEIEGDPRSRGRVVDPSGDVAQVLGDRFRMARHPAGPGCRGQRSGEAAEWAGYGISGALGVYRTVRWCTGVVQRGQGVPD